jgi:hypothetical protein
MELQNRMFKPERRELMDREHGTIMSLNLHSLSNIIKEIQPNAVDGQDIQLCFFF